MGEQGGDDEHIWTDLVTPERVAKGDLDLTLHEATGYIRHARTQDRTVLGYLMNAEKLDHHHRFYA